jgi:hypothetical protein
MSLNFGFIGWMKDDAQNHDKVWGYFFRPGPHANAWPRNVCIFYARRGKALQFKPDTEGRELIKLTTVKIRKGYTEIKPHELNSIWPSFHDEAKQKLSFEILVGNIE